MPEKPSAPDRVQAAFSELSAIASDLNSVSDELVATIAELNDTLKSLNLGVSAWVPISVGEDFSHWWSRDVGYSKVNNEWGISIRYVRGDQNRPEEDTEEKWAFADAPRWMRIDAVNKIPDLLEKLVKEAQTTTKRVRQKNDDAKAIATTLRTTASLLASQKQKAQ